MLGEALSMLVPQVVGFRLTGELPQGATATDLVLTVTEILRKVGVVGKFVEYFGAGRPVARARRPRDAREHEPGVRRDVRLLPGRRRDARSTCASTGSLATSASRSSRRTARRTCSGTSPTSTRRTRRSSSSTSATSSRRSPARAARRIACRSRARRRRSSRRSTRSASPYTNGSADKALADTFPASDPTTEQQPAASRSRSRTRVPTHVATVERKSVPVRGEDYALEHGSVVIAAITSCTNTSNPSVMIGAGLLAKKAVELGLKRKPWVKSSLAPGSKVVTEYYERAGLDALSRRARLQPRRLRLHDVHRQLGPAARRDRRGDRRGRARRLRGALRQPQLRGAHPLAT